MFCRQCGQQNKNGAFFCASCGTKLSPSCPSCGKPILLGRKFCSACGAQLPEAPAVPPMEEPVLSASMRAESIPLEEPISLEEEPAFLEEEPASLEEEPASLEEEPASLEEEPAPSASSLGEAVFSKRTPHPWLIAGLAACLVLVVGIPMASSRILPEQAAEAASIQVNGENADLVLQRIQGANLLALKDYQGAKKAFEKLETMGYPEEAAIGFYQLYQSMEKPEKAKEALQNGLKKAPESTLLTNALAVLELEPTLTTAKALRKENDALFTKLSQKEDDAMTVPLNQNERPILPPVEPDTSGVQLTGTTVGALANNSWIVPAEGWIYFANPADAGKLYKVQEGSTQAKKLCDLQPFYFNQVGDQIFCSDKVGIWKVSKEGGTPTQIYTYAKSWEDLLGSRLETEDESYKRLLAGESPVIAKRKYGQPYFLYAENDWIYFTPPETERELWRMKPDGGDAQPLDPELKPKLVTITADYLYFQAAKPGRAFGVYRTKHDGTGLELYTAHPEDTFVYVLKEFFGTGPFLTDRNAFYSAQGIEGWEKPYDSKLISGINSTTVTDDAVYSIENVTFTPPETPPCIVYSSPLGGSERKELFSIAPKNIWSVLVSGDWMYLIANEEFTERDMSEGYSEREDFALYRVSLTGGEAEKITF